MRATSILQCVIVISVVGACASVPHSSVGLYGNQAAKQQVTGSTGQGFVSRTVPSTRASVFTASKSAVENLGYVVETDDMSRGMLTASGRYYCDGVSKRVTMAVYVQPGGSSTESQMTVLFDNLDAECSLGNVPALGAGQVARETLRFLSRS